MRGPGQHSARALQRRSWVIIAIVVCVLSTGVALGISFMGQTHAADAATQPRVTSPPTTAGSPVPPASPDGQLARASATPTVTPTTGPNDLPTDALAQPDLFARVFITRLLTQDYRRPRDELLGWVQSHSAQSAEPLVVGLIPPGLRARWAVYSVTDTGSGPAPIPTASEWDRLHRAGAHTTVQVQSVTQPYAWTSAVAAGRVTDPGVTGRQVTAHVTLHGVANGTAYTTVTSVALSFNLEGPPARGQWGFVTLAAYTVVPVGQS